MGTSRDQNPSNLNDLRSIKSGPWHSLLDSSAMPKTSKKTTQSKSKPYSSKSSSGPGSAAGPNKKKGAKGQRTRDERTRDSLDAGLLDLQMSTKQVRGDLLYIRESASVLKVSRVSRRQSPQYSSLSRKSQDVPTQKPHQN